MLKGEMGISINEFSLDDYRNACVIVEQANDELEIRAWVAQAIRVFTEEVLCELALVADEGVEKVAETLENAFMLMLVRGIIMEERKIMEEKEE